MSGERAIEGTENTEGAEARDRGDLPPPLVGAQGRYIAERELGRGSSGITYLCRREADDALFVLKELRLAMIEEWKSLELFEREVATLRSLDHPGIPAYVDAVLDREQGRFALVQEYIEGRTLDALIRASESLSLPEYRSYLRGALEILAYLHARLPPVVHRDIKPHNLMISEGRIFLIDFGAVRLAFTESTTATSVGTFGYMAPEQIRGRAEPASDLYSLGMTFIALASRRQPEDLPVDPETGQIDPRGHLPLPAELGELLLAMIRPGLGHRLGSASEALARLDPAALAQAEPRRPAAPGRRRRRLRSAAEGLCGLLVFALIGGYVASRVPSDGELRTLGGWFSGHGGTLAAIQLTLLGDAYVFHPERVRALAFSPDGEVLASAASDGLILWRVEDGSILHRGEDSYNDVKRLAYSSDGTSLVGVDWHGKVHVYSPESGHLLRSLDSTHVIRDAVGDGSFRAADLWVGSDPEVRLLGMFEPPFVDADDPRHHEPRPDARLVVLDPSASRVLASTELPAWENFSAGAFSPDGQRVALAGNTSFDDPEPRYRLVALDLQSGETLLSTSLSGELRALAFSEGGRELLTLNYGSLDRWELARGERIGSLGTFNADYDANIAVAPPGTRIAISEYTGTALVEVPSGNRLSTYDAPIWTPLSLAFSPDGSILATGGRDQTIKLWHVP